MRRQPVSFAIALPPEWQGIDLLDASEPSLLEDSVRDVLRTMADSGEHAELLMVRALVAFTESGQPLAAGLAVALADREAPVSAMPLTVDSFVGYDVAAVTLPVGSGLRVRRIAPAPVLPGHPPLQVLRIQYHVHTVFGLLTITFTTPQAPRNQEWEQMFDAMAATAELA